MRAAFASRAASGTPLLVIHARRRDDDGPARATAVAGRKVGNAVARNRAKRRLRAALATTAVPPGHDLVIVARTAAVDAPFAALRHDLQRALTTAVRRT